VNRRFSRPPTAGEQTLKRRSCVCDHRWRRNRSIHQSPLGGPEEEGSTYYVCSLCGSWLRRNGTYYRSFSPERWTPSYHQECKRSYAGFEAWCRWPACVDTGPIRRLGLYLRRQLWRLQDELGFDDDD
jgi:hypothetical protein